MAIYFNKNTAKKYLSDTQDATSFYLKDGSKLTNIYQMRDVFKKMTQEQYQMYCENTHNDFAKWVGGVFDNRRLEIGLEKARTPKEARLYTDRNIKMLEKNANR